MDITKLVRPNIQRLKPYSSARSEFKGRAEVWLDANENPNDTGLNRYPDPLQWKVKQILSEIKGVPAEKIFLGNGSDEVIDLLIRIFCRPGIDEIITLPPTYGMYRVSADICDVAVREVPLTVDFQLQVEKILAAATSQSKILFICSPNNPTGNNMMLPAMQRLVENFPGIVVVDEAYIDFAGQKSTSEWLPQYPNLVVSQTFSKAWGLAGIRLGIAYANEIILNLMNKVKPPYNVNVLTQNAALEALQNRSQQQRWVNEILAERQQLVSALEDCSLVNKVFPSDANFVLARV
ncbi:MAG: histidinol-phosphate transaminase, partial [Bacteroidota bacterium]